MFELGKRQVLKIVKINPHGAFLGEKTTSETVLLPGKEIPAGAKIGDEVDVFLYKDSEDRLIATTREPLLQLGGLAALKVKNTTGIGAFLDWGLEKDLFLPFKEQLGRLSEGKQPLVSLYVDKSGRLCATMRIEKYLSAKSPYEKDAKVWGTVYSVNPQIGAFVAVENRYFGLIQAKDLASPVRVGDRIDGRVTLVREDGKLNLSLQQKAYKQLEEDAQSLLELFEEYEGVLPFTDKASPELIKREVGLTKNAFKRAVGHLLKEKKIRIEEDVIRKL